jgi:predicted ArsR family transcriptional regulator
MKFGQQLASGSRMPSDLGPAATEQHTRAQVCREILERGPVTAAQLARILDLTPAAVRRHLDTLLTDGYVVVWERSHQAQRGRGRPARSFICADKGHTALSTAYDDLAVSALRFLTRLGGQEALRQFADERAAEFEAHYRPMVEAVGVSPTRRARELARALSRDGYAATARPVHSGGLSIGVQLCQGHCPFHQVAREYPQLCESETVALSRLLGVHVQRLATLAHGAHVCTTHVPVTGTYPVSGPPPSGGPTVRPILLDGPIPQERTSR